MRHHGAGNAPTYHNGTTANYIIEPRSPLKDSLSRSLVLHLSEHSLSPTISRYIRETPATSSDYRNGFKHSDLAAAGNKCQVSKSFGSCSVVFEKLQELTAVEGAWLRGACLAALLLKSTTSFVNVANTRWMRESRPTDANNNLTWLRCLHCKHL